MTSWKILLTDGLEESGQAILRASAEVADKSGIKADELLKVIGEYDALIVRGRTKVTAEVFAAAGGRLKVVGRAGVGVDNIDLKAAKEHGVTVVNSPTATSVAVAELTLALMLGVAREVPRGDACMKANKWIKKELEGFELYGKTLGIIGFGRIGSLVGERARAFGMKTLGYDPLISAEDIQKRGGEPVDLDTMYAQADMITMHIPLTADSRNMLNAEAFAKMKKGVIIICAARGGVINEADLLAALNSGQVAAAGLDVFVSEPPAADDPLVMHPRTVCMPHVGAQTVEAQVRAAYDISTEVLAGLKGETLRWRVA
jgi:D-3-phosphoglycerate dehydrogenase